MSADILALLSHGLVATTSSGGCDYPTEENVRLGVDYGDGLYTGSLFAPDTTVPIAVEYSPAHIVSQMLIGLGYGATTGSDGIPVGVWPVYTNNEPTSPDNVVTVYDTDGYYHGRVQYSGEIQGPDGIQIRIRGKSPTDGWAKANQIRQLLESRSLGAYDTDVLMISTTGTVRYQIHSFCKISNVIVMGKESPTSIRRVFTINCSVVLDRCTN